MEGKRTEFIGVRFTKEERRLLEELSKKNESSIAEIVRKATQLHIFVNNFDKDTLQFQKIFKLVNKSRTLSDHLEQTILELDELTCKMVSKNLD